jgi:hypothetical protein
MIELRIVEHELGVKPEIQYRYMKFAIDPPSGCLCPDYGNDMWSEWQTAEWVEAETLDELAQGHSRTSLDAL